MNDGLDRIEAEIAAGRMIVDPLELDRIRRFAAFPRDEEYSDSLSVSDNFEDGPHDKLWVIVYKMIQMQVEDIVPPELRHLVEWKQERVYLDPLTWATKITWTYKPLRRQEA